MSSPFLENSEESASESAGESAPMPLGEKNSLSLGRIVFGAFILAVVVAAAYYFLVYKKSGDSAPATPVPEPAPAPAPAPEVALMPALNNPGLAAFTLVPGKVYSGAGAILPGRDASPEECANLCLEHGDCIGFTTNAAGTRCGIRSSETSMGTNADWNVYTRN